ncbi:MAG: DNA translocase FtsK, partial [Oscillospiraceae bacterium]|nr:DNA translocase FtsK [Oscillospiraceae bacterium]
IMVDPKMVELAPYNGIPHLLIPVVTDPKKAAGALQWAVYEMMKRYKTFSELGVKKLEEYNALARQREEVPHMASVIVVIDELADLMTVAAKEVEESICRVAQMGRAAGMHLVIATQSPRADVITGLMKANIPSRIAFAVKDAINSRIILDATGAEKLVGRGDMLYAPIGSSKPLRVQGCYITPEEIERVVSFVKSTSEVQYSDEVMQKIEENVQEKERKSGSPAPGGDPEEDDGADELLPAAVEVILETGQASVSMLQRRLKLGYSRAARLVDQMEQKGYVGPFEGSKPRQLLITRAKWQEIQMGGSGSPLPAAPEEDAPWDEED